jgi:phage RecT family recombinase
MNVLSPRPAPASGQHSAIDAASAEIVGLRAEFEKMLGGAIGVERFERAVLTAIQRDPDLLGHPRDSLVAAGLKAAQDRLLPDGREGVFVVRWNAKARRKEVTWAPMVYGIIKVAKAYGGVRSLSCEIVYQDEPFRILLGDEMRIEHERIPPRVVQGKEVGCYAIFCLSDGDRVREFMTAEEIRQVEDSSESAKKGVGPWKAWRGEMMRKSVIRRLAKRVPALDEGGEALRRVIERVDEDYAFGRPAEELAAPAGLPALPSPAVGPDALVSATAFSIEGLAHQLDEIAGADAMRSYLDDAGLQAWLARLRRNHPALAAEADTAITAAWERVREASSRDQEPEPPWKGMAWPMLAGDGSCQDMGDPDLWERAFEECVAAINGRSDFTAKTKRKLLTAVLAAHRDVLAHLREQGHGAAVEAVEGVFAEALGGVGEGAPA